MGTYRGVPQGSTLGPLLLCFIFQEIVSGVSYSYADLQIVLDEKGNGISSLSIKMNSILERITQWSKRNYLNLNLLKTDENPSEVNILLDAFTI